MNATERVEWGDTARRWWGDLNENRAARARLSRASPIDALAEEAVHDLYRWLGFSRNDIGRRLSRVAALACVLAKVREDTANSLDPRDSFFGRQIGRRTFEGKESAPLKPLRFKALLKAGTDEEIARGFQRAVLILRRRANVADLARTILWWDRDETRARLAFDYYGAGDASPSATRSEIEPHKDAHTEAQP